MVELKPLRGRRVLVTRAAPQAHSLSEKLRALGAEPVEFPTIRILPAEDTGPLDRAIAHIEGYDWVIFTSQNAIKPFWERLEVAGKDARSLAGVRIGAIGPATAAELETIGLQANFVPSQFVAEAVVAEIGDVHGTRILLPRADIAREALAVGLRDKGALVDEVVAYRTVAAQPQPDLWRTLMEEGVNIATFTASSTVRSFVAMLDDQDPGQVLHGALVACIGPITARTAEELGLRVDIIAEEHTSDGLVEAIVRAYEGGRLASEEVSIMERLREYPAARAPIAPGSFPTVRPRRLRRTPAIRRMVRETSLSADDFIYPLFVTHGQGVRREISSMPGQYQWSVDRLPVEAEDIARLGIPAVILFGIPAVKDSVGSENFAPDGIVQRAVRAIKETVPELVVLTDVCMCEYTDHGHCGIVKQAGGASGFVIDNDETLDILGRVAVSHAEAGADVVAPSGMMDGMVAAIRQALDQAGFPDVGILAYAAKYASAFYGPFREAAESPPQFGDRRSHQMDPANVREALREVALDIEEGADMVMVKPALPYLDVIRAVRQHFEHPVAAYNVSGEYAMVKAAGRNGWIDEKAVTLELLTGIKRAGADMILTYFAREVAAWLTER